MKWQVIQCEKNMMEKIDKNFYAYVNVLPRANSVSRKLDVRLDLMSVDNNPLVSFEGTPRDVRITFARYIDENCINLTPEHIAYIGYELAKADEFADDYVQN